MEEQVKYGFFDQFPVSFFHPSQYKELLPLKRRFRVGFVILITLLAFILETLIPFGAWDASVGGLNNLASKGIPEFTLENGIFTIESPIEIQMKGLICLKADSDVESFQDKDLPGDFEEVFLISKTNMILKHSGMVYEIRFSDLNYTFDNQALLQMMPMVKGLLVFSLLVAYGSKIIGFLISMLFFALICRSMAKDSEGKSVDFGTAFIFAMYARAPFILLSSLNSCLGYVANSLWVLLLGVFMTMQFMLLAERAQLGITKDSLRGEE